MGTKKINNKRNVHLFGIIVGIIISFMIMGMSATGSHSLTHSFKIGKVCDVRNVTGISVTTDESNNNVALYLPSRMFPINLENTKGKWKYLYLKTEFTDEFIDSCLHLYDKSGKQIYVIDNVRLTSGTNKIDLPEVAFTNIYVEIIEPQNCTVLIHYAQTRESERVEFHKKDILSFFSCFLIYIVLYCLFCKMQKKRNISFYKCIDVLQSIYIDIGNALLWIPTQISYKLKRLLRILLIIFWMFYMIFMANISKYSSEKYYKYHVIVCVIIVLLLAALMLEKPLKHINWNKKIVYYWLGLSILMCVSEYIYPKRYVLTGYVFILFFGFLYLAWNNMTDKNVFLEEILLSLKWSFPPVIIFSLIFREKIDGYGYAGPTWNPNIFAMYLVPVIIAILTEIEDFILQKKKKSLFGDLFLLDIAIAFVFLADSRAGNLMMMVVFLLFALHLKRDLLREKKVRKALIMVMAIVILEIPLYLITAWSVSYIPPKLGTVIEFPADDIKPLDYNEVIASEEKKDDMLNDIIYEPKVTKFLNGRNMYWMGYVRNLNFLGHEFLPKLWNGGRTAHNGVLAIAFQYGVLASVPYIYMFVSSIYLSFVVLKQRKNKYPFFIFGICVVSLGFMLVENFERPFLSTEWILFYLILGDLFRTDVSG